MGFLKKTLENNTYNSFAKGKRKLYPHPLPTTIIIIALNR